MAVKIVTGSMLKGLREACCRIASARDTLRTTNWLTLQCTINNSTGPHKAMNITRDNLLAKIICGYLK